MPTLAEFVEATKQITAAINRCEKASSTDLRCLVHYVCGPPETRRESATLAAQNGGIQAAALCITHAIADVQSGKATVDEICMDNWKDNSFGQLAGALKALNNLVYFSTEPHLFCEAGGLSAICKCLDFSESQGRSILSLSLNALFNCTFGIDRRRFDNPNPLPTLKRVQQTEDAIIKSRATLVLANLIGSSENEEDIKLLVTDGGVVEQIRTALDKSLKKEAYNSILYGAATLAFTLRNLCVNDRNKLLVAKSGVVPLLIELLDPKVDCVPSPSYMDNVVEATGALWQLSFDSDAKKELINAGVVPFLHRVVDNGYGGETGVKNAKGALWLLEGSAHAKSSSSRPAVTSLTQSSTPASTDTPSTNSYAAPSADVMTKPAYIMVSYNWAHQPCILKLRQRLAEAGIPVWIDVEQMKGSILETMADAVENSSIVIIAMSSHYKESANCRLEAEFTIQQKKRIIPLMMESGFKPSGWLGLLLGSKLYYDFTMDNVPEATYTALINEIKSFLTAAGAPPLTPAPPAISSSSSSPPAPNAPVMSPLATMDVAAVQILLKEAGVPSIVLECFRRESIDGKCVSVLREWQPMDVLNYLRNEFRLCLTAAQFLHLVYALKNLTL
eukprot:TRINITY_DN4876_c0_g1::TRINITY_DN4876_c0_g1_i1::g.1023::m.1023 TRINITY_DN4876_c0_g1::TRINITY_DN4876_c0_g1_i1::g.1023  ORF type:complete len:639 (-),score=63.38,TIR_2/PF13676.1/1.5e-16,TIR/PF01582.15/1.8e-05,Arm/PF00514.18/5.5e+03,Arm/PF00514.18/21,Arm/PF00514.18/1.6e+03,Arm/PF00514.18/7.5e+03,Arm/PF00514.18/0.006,Arm/PF00514.18/98,V-ATPase_H_N/PF03224.9/1.4e+03,V-ATPase_H_N/PF03224.9/0.00081,DUF2007/PF09413.5/3.7e+02,DUF2007/PF09413.5/1.8,DUF2007/PF09413.5/64,KAP/PF05804.7/13,KAP/PF05804.7/5.7 TR